MVKGDYMHKPRINKKNLAISRQRNIYEEKSLHNNDIFSYYIEIHGDVYLMYMLRSDTCDPRGASMIYA